MSPSSACLLYADKVVCIVTKTAEGGNGAVLATQPMTSIAAVVSFHLFKIGLLPHVNIMLQCLATASIFINRWRKA